MAKIWRLILDGGNDGDYNMAADEALLFHHASFRIPTLRIYAWKRPYVSLGYNQPAQALCPGNRLPLVRRMTGGAAIVHADELTYSLVCCRSDLNLPDKVKESYKVLCSFLIAFYARLGLKAGFAREFLPAQERPGLGRYGNLCFSSFEHFDLVINGSKIGGNAQRRRKDVIFQHGSIPQSIDFSLIKGAVKTDGNIRARATSLREQLNSTHGYSSLASLLAEAFRETFRVEFVEQGLFKEEAETLNSLRKHKYQCQEWNYRV